MLTDRRSARHRRRLRASVGSTPVFTADVGPGGFSAEILRVHPPGTPIDGSIRVNDREVAFRGEIAWARAGAPNMGIRGRIGVRFTMQPVESQVIAMALSLIGVL
jgi:hypothetical protein